MAADTHPEDTGDGAGDKAPGVEAPGDKASTGKASTALSDTTVAGLDASLAAATDRGAEDGIETGPRTLAARLLDYSAHAAMIVGLIGFAWTVSNHVVSHPAPVHGSAGPAAAAAGTPDPVAGELADLRQSNQRLFEEVRTMRANLDALSAKVRDDRTSAQVKGLQAGLTEVQGGLAAVRGETGSAVAQLAGRLDKVVHERAERDAIASRPQPEERAGEPDRNGADLTTGSLPPVAKVTAMATAPAAKSPSAAKSLSTAKPPSAAKSSVADAVPLPPSKPGKAMPDADAPAKPTVITAYVVRDVSGGVAVIEGRSGVLEVVPGVSIPGAGVVKSIERRGKGWTVITTKGQLAYAPPASDYRRTSQRDYYPAYRYDF